MTRNGSGGCNWALLVSDADHLPNPAYPGRSVGRDSGAFMNGMAPLLSDIVKRAVDVDTDLHTSPVMVEDTDRDGVNEETKAITLKIGGCLRGDWFGIKIEGGWTNRRDGQIGGMGWSGEGYKERAKAKETGERERGRRRSCIGVQWCVD